MLILGEVHTCLLRSSNRLSRQAVIDLLGIKPGQQVLVSERPVNRSVSPEVLVGVDCRLATDPQVKARGIGTVAVHAVVTGGLVLQSSARSHVARAEANQRKAWSAYAARPGVIDAISKASVAQLAQGHRNDVVDSTLLDLGSVSEYLIGRIQRRPQLDHKITIRFRPTRLRWTATVGDWAESTVRLHVDSEVLRTVELVLPERLMPYAERFCEDLALHDWLITALGAAVDLADRELAEGSNPIKILAAALERLIHLWMPGAHVDPTMRPLWDGLESRPGFTLQWNAQVARIRDLLQIRTLEALQHTPRQDASW
ncbi:MAG: SCO2521 family protein [Labedaea sp.]